MRLGSYSLIDEIKVQKQITISPYMSVSKTKKWRCMNISIKPLFCTTKHTNKTIDRKESERAWHWHDECQIEWRGHWWSDPSRIVPFSRAALEVMRKEYLLWANPRLHSTACWPEPALFSGFNFILTKREGCYQNQNETQGMLWYSGFF